MAYLRGFFIIYFFEFHRNFLCNKKAPSQKNPEKGRTNPRYHPISAIKLQLLTYYHTLSL